MDELQSSQYLKATRIRSSYQAGIGTGSGGESGGESISPGVNPGTRVSAECQGQREGMQTSPDLFLCDG